MAIRHISMPKRNNFKRIISQLDKTRADKKILKIVEQVQGFLDEHDIGWDAVTLFVPSYYVFVSDRRKATRSGPKAAAANGHSPTPQPLGHAGRELLRRAIARHADWPMMRETLDVEIHTMNVDDLRAVAHLLGISPEFIKLFNNVTDDPAPSVTPESNNEPETNE